MNPILSFLIFLFLSTNSFAGGESSTVQKINYKIISFKAADGFIPKAFIRHVDMMITLTLNQNKEFVFMENRWLKRNSSSIGELVKTTIKDQYLWNPENNYNKEHNKCLVTTTEKTVKGKSIRTFWIDVNHGKEKLIIIAEKINS
jgi:hypothetical protein